jgi:hypothetical protein
MTLDAYSATVPKSSFNQPREVPLNFRIVLSAADCAILKTGEAVGGNVHGSLKVARAMLDDAVTAQIEALRARRKIALHTKEADLKDDQPVISGPATGAQGPA